LSPGLLENAQIDFVSHAQDPAICLTGAACVLLRHLSFLFQARARHHMLFGRKNLFSATDAFPLTDAVLEFDDSSSVAVRPGRRALDGFGPRGERSASSKWWAVAGRLACMRWP